MRLVIPIGSPDPYREAWSQFRLLLKALRTRFWDQKPFILSHLLTGRCNANCQSCLWKLPAESRADELTTEQVMGLYAEAVACGFRELVLWGGEPLLRPDAPALLGFARNVGMRTTLITNGWSLADRHADVLPNVNRLILSLDAVGDLHGSFSAYQRSPGCNTCSLRKHAGRSHLRRFETQFQCARTARRLCARAETSAVVPAYEPRRLRRWRSFRKCATDCAFRNRKR